MQILLLQIKFCGMLQSLFLSVHICNLYAVVIPFLGDVTYYFKPNAVLSTIGSLYYINVSTLMIYGRLQRTAMTAHRNQQLI